MDQYGMRQYSNEKINTARRQADEYRMVQQAQAERKSAKDQVSESSSGRSGLLTGILNWLTSRNNAPQSRPL